MDNQSFEINILPAYHGDCIHLRFYSVENEYEKTEESVKYMEDLNSTGSQKPPAFRWYNIVIDSGPAKHKEGFSRLLHSIRDNGEKVDLLCFTHVDDDHILAAEKFFGNPGVSENAAAYIEKIWINIPRSETDQAQPIQPRYTERLSPNSAVDLYGYILWHNIPCETWISARKTMECGKVQIQTVLPTPARLDEYAAWWKQKRQAEQLSTDPVDSSESNGSSIVLLIDAFGSKLLFTGDAFAEDLEKVAAEYAGSGFDLIKLPHHGSKANISESMLDAMKCKYYIISADGRQKKLEKKRPSLRTIELIQKHAMEKGCVTLYGNYDWEYVRELVSNKKLECVKIITLEKAPIQITDKIKIRTE